MTFPSPDDAEALKSLVERDAVFKEKLDTAKSLAKTLGKEAIDEIYAAQLSLQRLSEGGYPPEMAELIKNKARKTIKRYSKFLSAMSSLKESRLSRLYGPGESPVNSLPSEILSIIFALVAQSSPTFDRKRWMLNTLRLVCRRWKETAEETPTLWRNVDITNSKGPEWTRRTVQWSKSVTLNVHIAEPDEPRYMERFMKCAQVALAELPRIRTLDISTSFAYRVKESREFAELLASRPAPSLIEFNFLPQEFNHALQTLSQNTFTGEIPAQLRILNVLLTKIHPLCPIFRAPLTSLTLQFCKIWNTANELLLALSGLPMLEHLMLRTNYPASQLIVSAVHDIGHKAVKLLNLKTLHILDGIEVLFAIFPRLDISNATQVTICAAVDYDEDTDFSAQIHFLPEMNNAFGSYVINAFGDNVAPPDAFTSLTITSADPHSTGYSAVFSDPAVHRDGLAQFSLGFDRYDTYVDELRALFMRTLSWTPMNYRISRLVAIEKVGLLHSDATWMQIFECLQSLEEVHVGTTAAIYFIRSITACNPDAIRSLRKLVFNQATLNDAMIDALAALLSARQGLGHPSLMLSFITCSIASEALDKLEGTPGVSGVYVHVDPRKVPRVGSADITSESV